MRNDHLEAYIAIQRKCTWAFMRDKHIIGLWEGWDETTLLECALNSWQWPFGSECHSVGYLNDGSKSVSEEDQIEQRTKKKRKALMLRLITEHAINCALSADGTYNLNAARTRRWVKVKWESRVGVTVKGKCRVTIVNLELLSKATIVGKCHKIKPYTRVKFTCHREDKDGQPQTDEAPTQQKTISGSTKRRGKGTSVFRWVNVHSYRCSQSAL